MFIYIRRQIMNINPQKRTLIFLNLLIICVATSFLSTALTTALPPIIAEFGIDAARGQWLTSIYSLVMGITMPLTAFLITRFPTKKLYITALFILVAGLIVCTTAHQFPMLMAGRILQACSNGITTSLAQVVLLTIYPPEKKGTIMGWYGLSVGAAPVIAPTIAGLFVDTVGWRMIFIVTLCILAAALLFAFLCFDDVLDTEIRKFDVLSFILSAFAFGGLTLGIGNISRGITNPEAYVPLIIGVIGSIYFVYRQLHIKQPFLELRVFRQRQFTISVLGSMFLYFIMMGGSVIMPIYVQTILGKSATISGLATLPGSLAMAIVSPFAGKIYDKLGMKKLAVCGTIGLFFSSLGMSFITISTPVWVASALFVIRCIAIGCMMMPFVTWGVSGVSAEQIADGNALITSLRTIAGAVGSAVFVGIMTFVSSAGARHYGDSAAIHGLNTAFAGMTVCSLIMFIMCVGYMKKDN
ncbi:MAG: multidrug efflux MFS transporter [Lachnospiraceae bacterium]|nr:multidrug efflux MFS transporter [Lachnospiraceae bacterium]